MVLCGLGMQQCAMHNATIQKTTFLELGVYEVSEILRTCRLYMFYTDAIPKMIKKTFKNI